MNSYVTTYYVCYRKHNGKKIYEDKNLLSEFNIIRNPFFYWAADPFVLDVNGTTYIFAELASKITGKGHIGFLNLNDKKPKWRKAYKTKEHLSFPNFIKHGDKYIGILETSQNQNVSLYELKCLPELSPEIVFTKTLIKEGELVDTVFDVDKDILLTYLCSYQNDVFKLSYRKFSQPDVIISSILDSKKHLRPAGNLFSSDSNMFLPTQCCQNFYGEYIIFNKIEIFNEKIDIKPIYEINNKDIEKHLHVKNILGCHT